MDRGDRDRDRDRWPGDRVVRDRGSWRSVGGDPGRSGSLVFRVGRIRVGGVFGR